MIQSVVLVPFDVVVGLTQQRLVVKTSELLTLAALLFNLIQIDDLRGLHQQDAIVVKLHLAEVVLGDFLLLDVLNLVWVDR